MRNPKSELEFFQGLLSDIYDASLDATLWPRFLEHLAHALDAKSGIFRCHDLDSKDIGFSCTVGYDPDYVELYKQHFVHIDPLNAGAERLPPGTMAVTPMVVSERSFLNSEYYNDYSRPQDMHHILGGFVTRNDSRVVAVGVHRPKQRDCFDRHDLDFLTKLVPHLQRAVHIGGYMTMLKTMQRAAGEALDRFPLGVILVDAAGKPVLINKKAEEIIASGAGLSIREGVVHIRSHEQTQELYKQIAEAVQLNHGEGGYPGGVLSIRNPARTKNVSILVTALKTSRLDERDQLDLGVNPSQAMVALFVGPCEQRQDFSLRVLIELYGLTMAEARLTKELANDRSLEEIAEDFQVTRNTLRTQLKNIFQKTQTKRQAELVRRVLNGPASLLI